jgi:hypothetical protein
LKERGFVEDLLEGEMIILKLNLEEYVTKLATGFTGHRTGTSAGLF